MKTLVGPWAEARKGRETHCWEVGLGVGFRDGAKARAVMTEIIRISRGRGWGRGRNLMGEVIISALGEGWSNGEDSVRPGSLI